MNTKSILFFFENISFSFQQRTLTRSWLEQIAKKEGKKITGLNYIFCSDEYLLSINQQHLQHDTYTDIVTFGYSNPKSPEISGDIFISIERVKENAQTYRVLFRDELKRVMAHGLLHLCGYKDKSPKDKTLMREKEENALTLFHKLTK